MKTLEVIYNDKGVALANTSQFDKDSILAKMKKNDCVVRAIACSFDISYEAAHTYVKELFKREDKKGTRAVVLKMRGLSEAFRKSVKEMGITIEEGSNKRLQMMWPYKVKGETKYAQYTTGKFLKDPRYSKGTYLILVSGHAFTIKDGVVYGNEDDATTLRARIEQAFKIGE